MIQTKKLLAAVSMTLLMTGSKLLLVTGCAPEKEIKIDEKEFIAREYYQCNCLSKEQTYKDSLENINNLLTPKASFTDTLNGLSIDIHTGTIGYCEDIMFFVIEKNKKFHFIPFCDEWSIKKDKRDTSLVNGHTLFAKKLREFLQKEPVKYPEVFVRNIFESVLAPRRPELEYIEFSTKADSIYVTDMVRNNNNLTFYASILTSYGIWGVGRENDSLKIVLINARNIKCYNH